MNSGETPERTGDLLEIIGEWLHNFEEEPSSESYRSVPVILVGLHACGSLTPSIFRSMFSKRTLERDCTECEQSCRPWTIAATVVVGCCYNMLDPKGERTQRCIRNSDDRTGYDWTRVPIIGHRQRLHFETHVRICNIRSTPTISCPGSVPVASLRRYNFSYGTRITEDRFPRIDLAESS